MRKHIFRHFSIAFFVVFLTIILEIFLSHSMIQSSSGMRTFMVMINHHRTILTLLRLGFYFAFFALWPKMIVLRAKRYHWPSANIPQAIRLRYPILMFFLVLEALGQFGPVGG